MFTLDFWKASAERAVKTFAQVSLALIGNDQVNILEVDLQAGVLVALTATVVSLLTSLASSQVGPQGSPSLVAVAPVASDETDFAGG